ncbi:MAG: ATP-binding protein [Catonella sp.]|uniref:ATP-binding protein n=1 Tax=Catonella sp. TaxID=2382125 RepID=UPI003FA01D24
MSDTGSRLDERKIQDLYNAFEMADNIVYRNYINNLSELDIVPVTGEFLTKKIGQDLRLIKVEKIVYDKDENVLQKLTNIYNMAYSLGVNLVMILDSDGSEVKLYIGICKEEDSSSLRLGIESLYNGFSGNFPGSMAILKDILLENNESKKVIENCLYNDKNALSVVSGVAGERSDKAEDNSKFVQGIEKLIDSMKGIPFSSFIIANPISKNELKEIKAELELLYSSLKPFEKSVKNFSENHSEGVSTSVSEGLADSFGSSKSKSLSLGTSESKAKTIGGSVGISGSSSTSTSTTTSTSASVTLGILKGIINVAATATVGKSLTETISQMAGFNASANRSTTTTEGTSRTNTSTESTNRQQTKSSTNTNTDTSSDSAGTSLQIEYINKGVKQLLSQIDLHLERIKKCENYGVFSVASYFLAKNAGYSSMAASTYKSLISGENTFVESANISTWDDKDRLFEIKKYLQYCRHPIFELYCGTNKNKVTAVSVVSGKELALHLGIPKKSVTGVVVSECVAFGRNTFTLSQNKSKKMIEIGNIYHMNSDEDTKVKLCVNDLAMHTFITGATGSGKSNAVYNLINRLDDEEIKFLVIEPAKGEYKHVFGNRKDVRVYGTNPNKTEMLRINPFSFPKDIHVLEHIDKLIEIFNVCWPMYAAMPAVLKEAVEKAYANVGWDLNSSENIIGERLFPTFNDVLDMLQDVVENSAFSEEVKSNYSGALLTRVKSLTNGINGRIFTNYELSGDELFDNNVIVDLSRVGAMDTKALIMGILVMKLQEHRVNAGGMNKKLSHVTVLEEAHNLLKSGASSTGAAEGANLVGKSVEMLSNIIAEVRTYGEGFIIVDQAPGLLDASVIRNTNTKIMLRLPDYEDRKLVGKAANLTDNQINEVAKLPVGVAAVYHNDWIEPVLCHIEKAKSDEHYEDHKDTNLIDARSEILKYLVDIMSGKEFDRKAKDNVERLLKYEKLSVELKVKLLSMVKSNKKIDEDVVKQYVLEAYGDCDSAFLAACGAEDIREWNDTLVRKIDRNLEEMDRTYQNIVLKTILEARAEEDIHFEDMSLKWFNYMTKHGLM